MQHDICRLQFKVVLFNHQPLWLGKTLEGAKDSSKDSYKNQSQSGVGTMRCLTFRDSQSNSETLYQSRAYLLADQACL